MSLLSAMNGSYHKIVTRSVMLRCVELLCTPCNFYTRNSFGGLAFQGLRPRFSGRNLARMGAEYDERGSTWRYITPVYGGPYWPHGPRLPFRHDHLRFLRPDRDT